MNQTIDIKTPIKCTMCNEHNCQTTWVITDKGESNYITTRDCDPDSYNYLPEWIYVKNRKTRINFHQLKNKLLKEIH